MSERSWNVREVLSWTTGHFERRGLDTPRLDAEVLLAHVLDCDRLRLYLDHDRPLDPGERDRYRELVTRRAAGEPAAYLIGRREFYGRTFSVDRRVLIPRPETELLVDRVLEALPEDIEGTVLDLCSGSGCIGITLLCERAGLSAVAVDVSAEAAEVARANAARHGVAARYDQRVGDLFAPLGEPRPFLALTANPPYVAEHELEGLQVEIREHEPRAALVAGDDGLSVTARIVRDAPAWLTPGALLALEHAAGQGEAVTALLAAAGGYEGITVHRDLAGLERLTLARRVAAPSAWAC